MENVGIVARQTLLGSIAITSFAGSVANLASGAVRIQMVSDAAHSILSLNLFNTKIGAVVSNLSGEAFGHAGLGVATGGGFEVFRSTRRALTV